MNYNLDDKDASHRTSIQKFYAGQSIFITGGTGFLGKCLIEKLLRSCPDISTIYLLIRSKKNKNPKTRLDEMLQIPLYDRLREETPEFRDKIVLMTGDLFSEGLGLSKNDLNILITKVSVIFHVAATVRFNEKIKIATAVNVTATDKVLNLAKCMPHLKSFIHMSTAYSNCYLKHIEESFYSCPIDHKNIITLTQHLSENEIDKVLTSITSQWPNTYTFTKAIAETLVRDKGKDLPIGIFRPAVVVSTVHEPIAGWVDNVYGPTGIIMSAALGLLRFLHGNSDVKAHVIPVDFTTNALIASAWDVYNHPHRKGQDMLIYNFTSPNDNTLTWRKFTEYGLLYFNQHPASKCVWKPIIKFVQWKIPYKISTWICHLVPALMVDIARICIGSRPEYYKY